MSRILEITTKQPTKLLKAVLSKLEVDPYICISNSIFRSSERQSFDWCTRKALIQTVDFAVAENENVILHFHDDPRKMEASIALEPIFLELSAIGLCKIHQTNGSLPKLRIKPSATEIFFMAAHIYDPA
jgi:hypothetical protein